MTKKIFYEKVGRKYVPVSEYDSEFIYSLRKGTCLVMNYPGGQSISYNIDPDYARLVAAANVAMEAMLTAMRKASEMKPQNTPITLGQQRAWKRLAKEFGDDLCTLSMGSAHDIAEAGVEALQKEASVLYSNPAVKAAYDHFILLCKLSKEQNHD